MLLSLRFGFNTAVCLFLLYNIVITELYAAEDDGAFSFDANSKKGDSKKADGNSSSEWTGFSKCDTAFCLRACSAKKPTDSSCDPQSSQQVCKCDREKFSHAFLRSEGDVRVSNSSVTEDSVCFNYCGKVGGYARVWLRNASCGMPTKYCICLTAQVTSNGFTLCDRHNREKCEEVCHNSDVTCAFNGACVCRSTWPNYFNLTEKNSRMEKPEENKECESKCRDYNYDWVGRVYDREADFADKAQLSGEATPFGKKFCLCGEEIFGRNATIASMLKEEGFQACTGIKCKQRCQSVSAYCEPENRRGCYCNNQNIFIKKHLWSRIPGHNETMCTQACTAVGLDARVIEWNPFFIPSDQRLEPYYRRTPFQYLYDGKFCHCIKIEMNLNQFRPCTDELCEFFCGHYQATCDMKTRRACLCNTHKLLLTTGRLPEPHERTCDLTCRANKNTGRIVDVTWKKSVALWGGAVNNKYCACVRPTSPSGLADCEPENDQCPKLCGHPESYCTRDKACQCGLVNLANKKNVRKGTLKEWDECSEKCRSWLWPVAVDMDNKAWIYDYGLESSTDNNNATNNGTEETSSNTVDQNQDPDPGTLTFEESPGGVALAIEAFYSWTAPKKYCLCAKSISSFHVPGFRGLAHIEAARVATNKIPCMNNHTCTIDKGVVEITY